MRDACPGVCTVPSCAVRAVEKKTKTSLLVMDSLPASFPPISGRIGLDQRFQHRAALSVYAGTPSLTHSRAALVKGSLGPGAWPLVAGDF